MFIKLHKMDNWADTIANKEDAKYSVWVVAVSSINSVYLQHGEIPTLDIISGGFSSCIKETPEEVLALIESKLKESELVIGTDFCVSTDNQGAIPV